MRTKIDGENVTHTFADVTDLMSYIQRPYEMHETKRSSITGTERFTGTQTLQDAIDLARKGWTGGNHAIAKLKAEIEKALEGQVPVPEREYGVRGNTVHLGRYMQGRPDCIGKRVDRGRRRDSSLPSIVHIVCNVSASQGITGTPLLMRGAAIIVLVDLLARFHIACSIELVSSWTTSVVRPDAPRLEFKLPLKHESDNVNIGKLAYFLGHPSSVRRIIFAAMEQEPIGHRMRWGIGRDMGGYGLPATSDWQGDLYIDRILTANDWGEDFAIAWLKNQLIKQGINLKQTQVV